MRYYWSGYLFLGAIAFLLCYFAQLIDENTCHRINVIHLFEVLRSQYLLEFCSKLISKVFIGTYLLDYIVIAFSTSVVSEVWCENATFILFFIFKLV